MKKIRLTLLTLAILCLLPASTFAYKEANGVVLNGKELKLDMKPKIENGRTLVPARALLESLGLNVTWNEKSKTIFAQNSKHRLKFTVEGFFMYYNDIDIYSDVPARVVNGRTLIPIRIIAEALGLDVSWDKKTSKVIIKTDTNNKKISLEEAHNILLKDNPSPEVFYAYSPFSSYASDIKSIEENTYIFHVNTYTDKSHDDYYTADFNYCINKNTGYIYEFHPGGEYFYSEINPFDPPSEEYRYPEYKDPHNFRKNKIKK